MCNSKNLLITVNLFMCSTVLLVEEGQSCVTVRIMPAITCYRFVAGSSVEKSRINPLGYEKVHLPLADTPFHIQDINPHIMSNRIRQTRNISPTPFIYYGAPGYLISIVGDSEPGVAGSSLAAANIFHWCTHMQ